MEFDDEHLLLRRVPMNPVCTVWDDNQQRIRPSSAAFEDHPNGTPMSVFMKEVLIANDQNCASVIEGHEDTHALASITVGSTRECQQVVEHAPTEEHLSHAHVVGVKSKKIRSKLAKSAQWKIPPK